MAIAVSNVDQTLLVRIERPPVNALDLGTIRALEGAFAIAAREAPRGGVVLTGSGASFSAGVDTRAYAAYGPGERVALAQAITRMTAQLLAVPVPLVAAVNGHALGGGFVLMLACDYRIAAERMSAKVGMTEAQAGIPFPAGPLEIIRHELTAPLLRRWTLSGAVFAVQELAASNIVDEVRHPPDLVAAAIAKAKELAAQPAFAAVKGQIRGPLARRLAELARKTDDA